MYGVKETTVEDKKTERSRERSGLIAEPITRTDNNILYQVLLEHFLEICQMIPALCPREILGISSDRNNGRIFLGFEIFNSGNCFSGKIFKSIFLVF